MSLPPHRRLYFGVLAWLRLCLRGIYIISFFFLFFLSFRTFDIQMAFLVTLNLSVTQTHSILGNFFIYVGQGWVLDIHHAN